MMTAFDWLGWSAVIAIWAVIVWILVNVLGFTDPDPDERDKTE